MVFAPIVGSIVKMNLKKTMKRTPLNRKTPLKQGDKPLRQRSGFKRPSKDGKGPPYRGSKIRQRSKKREKDEKEYSRLRKEFLAAHPKCHVCNVGLGRTQQPFAKPATEVHHKAGRGKFYLRVDTWLPVCHFHHERITNSRTWAEDMGYSLTKAERRAL